MFFSRKKLSTFIVFFLFCFTVFLVADSKVHAIGIGVADVGVLDVTTTKTDYKAGETVFGTFTLHNNTNNSISNVRYRIYLMGDYKDGNSQEQYDYSVMYSPISIDANKDKVVNFTYKIPGAINNGEFGIQVHTMYDNGNIMGWNEKMINITGGTGMATIKSILLSVNGRDFYPQEGPTFYSGQKGTLNIKLENSTSHKITLTPSIDIYRRTEPDKILFSLKDKTLSIEPGAQAQASIDLPNFNYEPQVYVGDISFLGADDTIQAPKRGFRYIIGGDIVTINSVSSDKSNVAEGQIFNVNVNYSGAPMDLTTGKPSGGGTADFNIKIFNQNNKLVASYSDKTDFNNYVPKTISFTAKANALALRTEITVTKDNKTLASYKSFLSTDYQQKAGKMDIRDIFSLKNIIIFAVILIIILSIIFFKRLLENKILFAAIIIILFVLIGIFLFIILFMDRAQIAKADACRAGENPCPASPTGSTGGCCASETVDYNLNCQWGTGQGTSNTLTLTLNAIGAQSCGQNFTINASIQDSGCGNGTHQMTIGGVACPAQQDSCTHSFTITAPSTRQIAFYSFTASYRAYGGAGPGSFNCGFTDNYNFYYQVGCPICGIGATEGETAPPAGGWHAIYAYGTNVYLFGSEQCATPDTANPLGITLLTAGGSKTPWTCTDFTITKTCKAERAAAPTPTPGACGTAERQYATGELWPGGYTYCNPSSETTNPSPMNPNLPAGGSISWTCNGLNGGKVSETCTATRVAASLDGQCGTADGHNFDSGETSYGSYTQCMPGYGNPSDTNFPAQGGSVSWTCSGQNGGQPSKTCTATRGSPDACGNAATSGSGPNPGWHAAYAYTDVCKGFPPSGYALCATGSTGANPSNPVAPILGDSVSWSCGSVNCQAASTCPDSGLRVYNGGTIKIAGVAESALTSAGCSSASPLKIYNGGIYDVLLVPTTATTHNSGARIQTSSGPQAMASCP